VEVSSAGKAEGPGAATVQAYSFTHPSVAKALQQVASLELQLNNEREAEQRLRCGYTANYTTVQHHRDQALRKPL
jgi:hypothetical protein